MSYPFDQFAAVAGGLPPRGDPGSMLVDGVC